MAIVRDRVAIIGGGYAGCAAAVELVDAGIPVTLYEAGQVLGGRARRVEVDGKIIDNGQHLLVGAYTELLRLIERVHVHPDSVIARLPLALVIKGGARLRLPRLPAPFDRALGLLFAGGLSLHEKWALLQLMRAIERTQFRLDGDPPLAAWLAAMGQPQTLVHAFWEPLCLAAMNTPVALASAQVFVNVLRDSLLGPPGAADMVLPIVDLSALFPEAAAEHIRARGGVVQRSTRVLEVAVHGDNGEKWRVGKDLYTHVIIATSPRHAAPLVLPHDPQAVDRIAALSYQPITTVWLQFSGKVRLPRPMIGLYGATAQWVFDRGQITGDPGLLAVVISADGEHVHLDRDTLQRRIIGDLHARLGVKENPQSVHVITERRATFACLPNMRRPAMRTRANRLLLAGDYVEGDYPATLEGAVRSGIAAARLINGKRN